VHGAFAEIKRAVISFAVNVSGSLAYARAGWPARGLAAPGGNAGRLLDGQGAALQALDSGRAGIDRIQAALVRLRDALQAARAAADAVPGRTALQPVVADIEQTADKPTFVTIDGETVQSGTITVSLGPRPLIVGYERARRAPLDVGEHLKALAANAATLVVTVGTGGTSSFAADVAALLRSPELTTAVNAPDAGAIDAAIGRINATLAKVGGLGLQLSARTAAAAQVDLGGLLLAAGAAAAGPTG
jgi:hypothetical protein